ncbi:MAG: response regulator [Caldilineaceae bacterium]|nr:response regulator [Caldilineaceae bacterium]
MPARILVADDDTTLQRLVLHTLKNEGHEVIVVGDGQQALDKIESDKPDLVILDVMMPVLNGFEVCAHLRENPATMTLPVIMLSGLGQVQEKVTGLKAGADEYLTKPIDPRELAVRVEVLLQRNRVLRASATSKAGNVISLIGAKGGVGTTTLAVNLAAVLAQQGKSVILAELRNDFGTLSAQLRATPDKGLSDLLKMDAGAITDRVVSSHLYATHFHVRVLFGPQQADAYGNLDAAHTGAILGHMMTLADFVLIDLAPIASVVTETAIKSSNHVFVTTEPEIASVAATTLRLKQIADWASNVAVSVIIVNRQGTMLLALREIENRLGRRLAGVVPPSAEALGVAIQYGTPLALYQSNHLAMSNIRDLATRLAANQPLTPSA